MQVLAVPVSYTHLDVYKRQGESEPGVCLYLINSVSGGSRARNFKYTPLVAKVRHTANNTYRNSYVAEWIPLQTDRTQILRQRGNVMKYGRAVWNERKAEEMSKPEERRRASNSASMKLINLGNRLNHLCILYGSRAAFTEFGPTTTPVGVVSKNTAYAIYCTCTKSDFSALL